LIFVGQWLPPKGIRYLAKAFSKLAARRDLELFCVGTGSSPELVRETFPMVSRSHVTVIPSVNRKELYDQLTHADVFVFPSLSEGFSRALLEALAAGVPVVASDVGAAADLLTDGDNAIVVAPGDAAALSAGIERLLDDARLRAELAAAGQRTASRYTADAALAGFADALFEGVRRRSLERSTQMVAESDVHS
jgi:glycosyltransferase involved in cell wall biosynthesis